MTVTFRGETHELREYPYRDDEDNLVFPLIDGSNVVCHGAYLTDVRFEGLDYTESETVTITGERSW